MNRLGMIVDLAHASKKTMIDAFATSTAPIMYSHAAVAGLNDITQNSHDDILTGLVNVFIYFSKTLN